MFFSPFSNYLKGGIHRMCIVAHRTDIPVAPSATYFRLNIDLLHLLPLGDRAPTLSFFTLVYPLIFKSYAASRLNSYAMGVCVWICHPRPRPRGSFMLPGDFIVVVGML